MKIEIEVSEENEGTSDPWWMIIDPAQNLSTQRDACHVISSMITGPFFSREEAERVLKGRRHHYGTNAVVFCASGCYTNQYSDKIKAGMKSESFTLPLASIDLEQNDIILRATPEIMARGIHAGRVIVDLSDILGKPKKKD